MAYLVELEDDFADSDVPTTVVRSKVDCPTISEMSAASSTNDLVVNKLTQILAYLRQGERVFGIDIMIGAIPLLNPQFSKARW